MRRRCLATCLTAAAVLAASTATALAASASASASDSAGDVTATGNTTLTQAQRDAIDILNSTASADDDALTVTLTLAGPPMMASTDWLANFIQLRADGSTRAGWALVSKQGDMRLFYHYVDDSTGSHVSDLVTCPWTERASGNTVTFVIQYACFTDYGYEPGREILWTTASQHRIDRENFHRDNSPDESGYENPDPLAPPASHPRLRFPDGAPDKPYDPTPPPPDPDTSAQRRVPTARTISDTCDAQQSTTFNDIAGTSHEYTIRCVASFGIAQGTGGGKFSSGDTLSSAQTATFLRRTLDLIGKPVPAGTSNQCSYTGYTGTHRANIEALMDAGIADFQACDLTVPMTRGRMAEWVYNALWFAGGRHWGTNQDWYDDVIGTRYEYTILSLTAVGIVTGTGDRRFSPDTTLTRGQMATFLARSVDYARNAGL